MVILPENDNICVKKSVLLEGQLGVIARRKFKRGELIFNVIGPIKNKPTKYSFSVGINEHIDPQRNDGTSDFGHYLNHSCDPNTKISIIRKAKSLPYIEIIANKSIEPEEELTFDYATLEYEITTAGLPCKCGAKNCRKVMQGFKDLPTEVVEKYEKERMIPKYLLLIKKP